MEIVALESSLIKGMVELLPAPGSVYTAEDRAHWLDLMGKLFPLVYQGGALVVTAAKVDAALVAAAKTEPLVPAAPEVLEARPVAKALSAPVAFGVRLRERKAATANAVPADKRVGKPKARDIILAVLGKSPVPLRVHEIVSLAEKQFKGHGFKNLYGAISFSINKMDGTEVEWDEGLHGKVWKLSGS